MNRIFRSAIFYLILIVAVFRTARARNIRKMPEQAVDTGAFPVPPIPTAPKETTHA